MRRNYSDQYLLRFGFTKSTASSLGTALPIRFLKWRDFVLTARESPTLFLPVTLMTPGCRSLTSGFLGAEP
jgi:hypothetical protein